MAAHPEHAAANPPTAPQAQGAYEHAARSYSLHPVEEPIHVAVRIGEPLGEAHGSESST